MQSSNLGGTERAAIAAMRMLHQAGASFRVTSPRPTGLSWPDAIAVDPEARAFPCRNAGILGKFDPLQFRALRAHIRAVTADTSAIWISGSSVTSLLASQSIRQPRMMSQHYHHCGNWATYGKWKGFYDLLCRDLDAITFPSEFTRSQAVYIAPGLRSRAHVVPLGYELYYVDEPTRQERRRQARCQLNLPADAFIIGGGGRLLPEKRYDVFLDTAVLVLAGCPDAYFVICGGGPLEVELKQRVAKLGIESKIRFTGWATAMQPYYQAWDVILFNSDFEAMGRMPMEAASHGAVVVASVLHGGLSDFVAHGRNGYLLDRHDPEELSALILKVTSDQALAMKLRQQAALDLATNFSPQQGITFYRDFFSL